MVDLEGGDRRHSANVEMIDFKAIQTQTAFIHYIA